MSFFRTDDPNRDFDRWDAKEAAYHARLPKCDFCNQTIEDEIFFELECENLCERCLRKKYERSCYEYAEGHE